MRSRKERGLSETPPPPLSPPDLQPKGRGLGPVACFYGDGAVNICNAKHDEIVYEGHQCPICQMIEDYERDIDDLHDQIENLKDEIKSLEEQPDNAAS